jgi:hypothetical protein
VFIGAVVAIDNSMVVLYDSHFSYNVARVGGAVFFHGASISLVKKL